MKIIDVHAHINRAFYKEDFLNVLKRAKENQIGFINIGTNLADSKENVEIAQSFDHVWAIVGMHPTEKEDFNYDTFRELAMQEKVVGIGECGLDYFREENKTLEDKERQRRVFGEQIKLAKEVNKPLMLHLRMSESYEEAISLIESLDNLPPVVFHFYSGNMEQTKRIMALKNAYVSIGGVITFTHDYDKVIKEIPLKRILLETDSPFITPVPYRGQRNEPAFVVEVLKRLAVLKEMPIHETADVILSTTKHIFGLK